LEGLILAGTTSAAIDAKASGGEALYEKSCAGCHGPDGKGNAKMAKIVGDGSLNIVGKEDG